MWKLQNIIKNTMEKNMENFLSGQIFTLNFFLEMATHSSQYQLRTLHGNR